ncbi:MAG: DUF4292 domain-containing protein [Bacteroidales bacterium]
MKKRTWHRWRTEQLIVVGLFLYLSLSFWQCKPLRQVTEPVRDSISAEEMWAHRCREADTIRSLIVRDIPAMLEAEGERYEVELQLRAVRDSFLYISGVSSGYEILRAYLDLDSIRVIDRINKVVYHAAYRKHFGYGFPVNFWDIQRLIDAHYLCGWVDERAVLEGAELKVNLTEELTIKEIRLDSKVMELSGFVFRHLRTGEFLIGERRGGGFFVASNFLLGDVTMSLGAGSRSYNDSFDVRMNVNERKYTRIDL